MGFAWKCHVPLVWLWRKLCQKHFGCRDGQRQGLSWGLSTTNFNLNSFGTVSIRLLRLGFPGAPPRLLINKTKKHWDDVCGSEAGVAGWSERAFLSLSSFLQLTFIRFMLTNHLAYPPPPSQYPPHLPPLQPLKAPPQVHNHHHRNPSHSLPPPPPPPPSRIPLPHRLRQSLLPPTAATIGISGGCRLIFLMRAPRRFWPGLKVCCTGRGGCGGVGKG